MRRSIALHSSAHHAAAPGIAEAYTRAAEIPAVLDGLYCYCDCGRHAGRYSLLDCFRDEHAATCGAARGHAAVDDGRGSETDPSGL